MFATLHAGIGVKQTHSYARSLEIFGTSATKATELGEESRLRQCALFAIMLMSAVEIFA